LNGIPAESGARSRESGNIVLRKANPVNEPGENRDYSQNMEKRQVLLVIFLTIVYDKI
jgi:hypothetical protein